MSESDNRKRKYKKVVFEHPDNVDEDTLDLILEEFRRVETQRIESVRAIDERVRGMITASSLMVAALGVAIRDVAGPNKFSEDPAYLISLALFFLFTVGFFLLACWAWRFVVVGLIPDPADTWSKFLGEPPGEFKYAMSKWIAEDFASAENAVWAKGDRAEWAGYALIRQSVALGATFLFAMV